MPLTNPANQSACIQFISDAGFDPNQVMDEGSAIEMVFQMEMVLFQWANPQEIDMDLAYQLGVSDAFREVIPESYDEWYAQRFTEEGGAFFAEEGTGDSQDAASDDDAQETSAGDNETEDLDPEDTTESDSDDNESIPADTFVVEVFEDCERETKEERNRCIFREVYEGDFISELCSSFDGAEYDACYDEFVNSDEDALWRNTESEWNELYEQYDVDNEPVIAIAVERCVTNSEEVTADLLNNCAGDQVEAIVKGLGEDHPLVQEMAVDGLYEQIDAIDTEQTAEETENKRPAGRGGSDGGD